MTHKKYLRWVLEFLSIVAISVILKTPNWSPYWIVVPVLVVILLKVFEYRTETTEAYGKIHAQLNLLLKLFPFESRANVRCTYFVPSWGARLFQAMHYIPAQTGGGRRFKRSRGIIGKAFREKRSLVENFRDGADYRRRMVSDYNYTPEEVGERSVDRRSYFCHPLMDENHKILGLVYLDSVLPNTFPMVDDPSVDRLRTRLDIIRDSIL